MLTVDLSPINEFRYSQVDNYNFQYILLDENLRAVHSPFMCKDYLQDIFYCEYTGNSAGIWGINWKPGMLNINVDYFHMVLHGGSIEMRSKIPTLLSFVNQFELAQGIPLTEIEETEDDKMIVIKFSKQWTQNGPLLSAYTTLLRIGGTYSLEETPIEYLQRLLKEYKQTPVPFHQYMLHDVQRLPSFLEKLNALLYGQKVEHDWKSFSSIGLVHNTGIMGYKNFPKLAVE